MQRSGARGAAQPGRKGRILASAGEPLPRLTAQRPSLPSHLAYAMLRWSHLLVTAPSRGACAACVARCRGAPVRTEHVEAELVAEQDALIPGPAADRRAAARDGARLAHVLAEPRRLGIADHARLEAAGGTHRRRRSSGPRRSSLPAGPLVNYGYEGEVLLLTDIAATPDFLSGQDGHASPRAPIGWCARKSAFPKAPICRSRCRWRIDARSRSALGQADRARARGAAATARRLETWPRADTARRSIWRSPRVAAGGDPGEVRFFPFSEGKIEAVGAADPRARVARRWLTLAGREPARRRRSRASRAC